MGMTVMVMDREKIISLLKEMSDYFRECRTNASLGSKAENHFWELQIAAQDAATLLKSQEAVVRCKDCKNWIPGYITDQDDFIPPKCGKYQQMVGHSSDDFCSLAEKQEGR